MPETKNKTLEEIDVLFQRPTRELVAENVKNVTRSLSNFFAGRWGKSAENSADQAAVSDEKPAI